MRLHRILILLILLYSLFSCKTENYDKIIVKLTPDKGKDAIIRYCIEPDTINYGDHPLLNIHAWTNNGNPVIHRSLFDFDLTKVPSDLRVINAYLYLYGLDPNLYIGDSWPPGCFYGKNACFLRRITSEWEENTVNWENQPNITNENAVFIPIDNSECHFYKIDITNLIRDYLNHSDSSHGFMIQLTSEEFYRRLTFASSDFSYSEVWPKLEINY